MDTEFDLIFEDFSDELQALSDMSGLQSPTATARSRIAAGNAATLLLAAVFEEYIRQQVRMAFKQKAIRARTIEDFPKGITVKVWKKTLENLLRVPISELDGNSRNLEDKFSAAIAFSLKKDITSEVSEAISHNENNMRPDQINNMFSQIGISGILGKCAEHENIIDLVGGSDPSDARIKLVARIEDFFRRRNMVAHAIKLGSSSGPTEIANDIGLFFTLGKALCMALAREIPLDATTAQLN